MSAAENFLDQLMGSIPSDFLEGLSEDILSDIQEKSGLYNVDLKIAYILVTKPLISSRTYSIMEKYSVDALTALQLLDMSEREVDEFFRPVQVISEYSENACGGGSISRASTNNSNNSDSRAAAAIEEDPTQWTCVDCTVKNHSSMLRCEICEAKKPKPLNLF